MLGNHRTRQRRLRILREVLRAITDFGLDFLALIGLLALVFYFFPVFFALIGG